MHDLPRAGLGRRALAFLLDCLFLFLVPFLITSIIVGAMAGGDLESGSGDWWVMLLLIGLEGLAYFTVLEARSGRTLGKRALGLRVVTLDGRSVSFGAALVRNLLRIIDGQPGGFFLLGAIMVLFMPGKQRLGDLAAKTAVVRTAPSDTLATDPALAVE